MVKIAILLFGIYFAQQSGAAEIRLFSRDFRVVSLVNPKGYIDTDDFVLIMAKLDKIFKCEDLLWDAHKLTLLVPSSQTKIELGRRAPSFFYDIKNTDDITTIRIFIGGNIFAMDFERMSFGRIKIYYQGDDEPRFEVENKAIQQPFTNIFQFSKPSDPSSPKVNLTL